MEYKILDQDPMKLNEQVHHLIKNKIDQILIDIVHLNKN
jgi:hypothetical protein